LDSHPLLQELGMDSEKKTEWDMSGYELVGKYTQAVKVIAEMAKTSRMSASEEDIELQRYLMRVLVARLDRATPPFNLGMCVRAKKKVVASRERGGRVETINAGEVCRVAKSHYACDGGGNWDLELVGRTFFRFPAESFELVS